MDESDSKIRFTYSNAIAVYSGNLPEIIQDFNALTLKFTYVAQKEISELLIDDFTRKFFVHDVRVNLNIICIHK